MRVALLVSLSLRLNDLLAPVTRVKKKKRLRYVRVPRTTFDQLVIQRETSEKERVVDNLLV